MKKIFPAATVIVLCVVALLSSFGAKAQDTIYKRNKETINAKIIEIGVYEIKYKMPGDENGATIIFAKDQNWKIVFASGVVQVLQPEMFNPENYAMQKRNAIKTDFIAALLNHITFIYGRSLKPGQSIEASVAVIGIGANSDHGI